MAKSLYGRLLKEIPINDDETHQDYTRRVWHRLEDYGIRSTQFKTVMASIRDTLPYGRSVKIAASQTLDKDGNLINERFRFIKDVADIDKEGFEATSLTTNPNGTEWVRYNKVKRDYMDVRDTIVEEMKTHSPKYPEIKREKKKEACLLVVDPADIHIGKLSSKTETGETYNSEIAVKRVIEGITGIINKVSGFQIDKQLLIIGNDILHTDTAKGTTTKGTPLDTDGMWYDNFMIAKNVYVQAIEILLQVSDIEVHYNPSNHDFVQGFMLADCLSTWFRNSRNIVFKTDMAHRKYYRYHQNLIGTTHGDGAKDTDLPLLMAQESKDWTECRHRYIYTHHIHHKKSKDYGSVCIESLRSPSGSDGWHHRNGFQHAPQAVEGFVHSKENGQVARITHIF